MEGSGQINDPHRKHLPVDYVARVGDLCVRVPARRYRYDPPDQTRSLPKNLTL